MKYGGHCEYLGPVPLDPAAPLRINPKDFQVNLPSEEGMCHGVRSSPELQSGATGLATSSFNPETARMPPGLLQDLKLMHYYTAFTCLTISDFASFNSIWQEVVPQQAHVHPFLMYGILALAALHIGHDRPQERHSYTAIALRYYNVALASFRTTLKQVTADNCTALFGFSAILIVLSLGFAQSHSTSQTQNVDELIQVFTLLQGVRVVLQSAMPWVEQGPLGPLLQRGAARQKDASKQLIHIPRDFDEALSCLERCNERISQPVDSRETYSTAIKALKDCVGKVESNPGDRAAALSWLVFLQSPYVSTLKSNQPLGLVILAHYGIILHGLRDHWFIDGFGVQLIQIIHLNLAEEWRAMIDWPMRRVGLKGEPGEDIQSTQRART